MNYSERLDLFELHMPMKSRDITLMDGDEGDLYSYLDFHLSKIIDKTVDRHELLPTHLIFTADSNINGFVLPCEEYCFLGITTGFVHKLQELFENSVDLFSDNEIRVLREISRYGGINVNNLSIQICLLYLIHHELGHVFQFTNHKKNQVPYPELKSPTEYDFFKHCMEIDADYYCAIQIANYTIMWLQRLNDKYGPQTEIIQAIINIFLGTILTYRLFLLQNSHNFYLKEYHHPHLTIRITSIHSAYFSYLNNELKKDKYAPLNLDLKDLANESLNFLTRYSFQILKTDSIGLIYDHLLIYQKEIVEYRQQLVKNAYEMNLFAIHSWNEFSKKDSLSE